MAGTTIAKLCFIFVILFVILLPKTEYIYEKNCHFQMDIYICALDGHLCSLKDSCEGEEMKWIG